MPKEIWNLEWCTSSDNKLHAFAIGLRSPIRGERHGNSKLTGAQVMEIPDLYDSGDHTQEQIAAMYGVNRRTIGKIINGERWAHLDQGEDDGKSA